MSSHPCPRCGALVVNARVTHLEHRAFDAQPVEAGAWSVYQTRAGARWHTIASQRQNPTGVIEGPGHRLHDCPGRTGEQMQLEAP